MDDNRSPATAFVSSAWREKRVIAISLLIALSQFQYGFDAAAVAGFQSMPGFLVIFGYVDVRRLSLKSILEGFLEIWLTIFL